MQKSSCLECRFGVVKKQKMRAGVDKYGKARLLVRSIWAI
jgi:hypothetical protein